MNKKNKKLKMIIELSQYGDLVKIKEGSRTPFDVDNDDIDLDADYELSEAPLEEIKPGQVWKRRGGGTALILKKEELGGFPRKEYTYFRDDHEEGFFRVDEYGRAGDEPNDADLVQKIANNPAKFFQGNKMIKKRKKTS